MGQADSSVYGDGSMRRKKGIDGWAHRGGVGEHSEVRGGRGGADRGEIDDGRRKKTISIPSFDGALA